MLFFLALLYLCCSLLTFLTGVLLCLPLLPRQPSKQLLFLTFLLFLFLDFLLQFFPVHLSYYCYSFLSFHTAFVPGIPLILKFVPFFFLTVCCSWLSFHTNASFPFFLIMLLLLFQAIISYNCVFISFLYIAIIPCLPFLLMFIPFLFYF
jgi:hypothetical protein